MSVFGKWLSRGKATVSHERLDLQAEAQNMDLALRAAEKIMNDDIVGAEEALKGGDSAFHKLSKGTLGFMKSTLGFEQEVMKEATQLLAEAENSAYTYYYKAQHDTSAFQSNIYDKGAEFLLCQAEAQIMSAVVGVLNESLTESLKGFYKMRKAYMILESLMAQEQKYMQARAVQSLQGSHMASKESLTSLHSAHSNTNPIIVEPPVQSQPAKPSGLRNAMTSNRTESPDSDEFVEADENHSQHPVTQKYEGHLGKSGPRQDFGDDLDQKLQRLDVNSNLLGTSPTPSEMGSRPPLSRTTTGGSKFGLIEIEADDQVFKNSLDVFIHSGTNLMFGIISLMISVIPPTFAKVLAVIGFRGNREKGMRMLWQASRFSNVNGGMAALVLFGWYNGLIGFCDIYSDPDPSVPLMDQVEGYPSDRLKGLLAEMRNRYPDSHLWMIEEARMAAAGRDIDRALELLGRAGKSDMKQLQALQVFEKSLNAQNSHHYELCAESFLECVELNAWSQALYYFVAGAALLQRSRDLAAEGNAAEAQKLATLAEEHIKKAPSFVGKKKMMGRQLPFDLFVQRKVNKWTANSAAWGCSFLDAVGVPPIEESIFLWNGYKKMNESQLQKSLQNLERAEQSPHWDKQGIDAQTVATLLRATIYRNLRQHKKAQAILEENVFVHDKSAFSAPGMDTWAAPASYYEHAVNSWQQRNEYIVRFGTSLAGPSANQQSASNAEIVADRVHVASARKHVETAKNWGSYELDARIGMKITAALGAIGKWEARNGVA
ncbi:Mitochondrial outer membrane protein iml2 [Lithohypha guttulata]|uniref:Mitochondrial outer membrane protein iml2 n=1 Tax=Lithohypha guttulata TaxID=1690604 RepID=UPI002DE01360|nr:Mitochondrial outer membrane protein iml2 [Lithohypha guttulata]KAK5096820.1 Mitochondrial outer membrane protein iml2 [Lithohypha guttulata]